jgi:uncharacterized protein (TIGR02246 family)
MTNETKDREAGEIVNGFLQVMQQGWNAADGSVFMQPFVDACDFVNIRGALYHGREPLVKGHDEIFSTIYKGTTVTLRLTDARFITPDCILAHSGAVLDAPGGPFKGMASTQTIVAVRDDGAAGAWRIVGFQNTVVAA